MVTSTKVDLNNSSSGMILNSLLCATLVSTGAADATAEASPYTIEIINQQTSASESVSSQAVQDATVRLENAARIAMRELLAAQTVTEPDIAEAVNKNRLELYASF